MKIIPILAALLLVSSLATPTTAQERSYKSGARAQAYGTQAVRSQLRPGALPA